MRFPHFACFALSVWVGPLSSALAAEEPSDADAAVRRQGAKEFHRRAQERTGLLVPLYVYPGEARSNAAYNRLIDLKRRHETVPVWVIVNPASGPGESVDANYVEAIDRLVGAGCVVIGYVSTSYGKRSAADVGRDVDRWRELYPRTHGIFFDEMLNDDTEAAVAHQAGLKKHAEDADFWPTVANPGTETPGRYFAAEAADVFVVHEGSSWPEEGRLTAGANAIYPPFTRAVLVHSRPTLGTESLRATRKYARWVYVTDDAYRPGDPNADNPWDGVPTYFDELFTELDRD